MAQFLVTIYRPFGADPWKPENDAMAAAIDRLNEEMIAAGVRVFVGGLRAPAQATSIRWAKSNEPLVSRGVYLRSSEFMDGLWVLEAADLNEALAWGQKAAVACGAGVEVRPFY